VVQFVGSDDLGLMPPIGITNKPRADGPNQASKRGRQTVGPRLTQGIAKHTTCWHPASMKVTMNLDADRYRAIEAEAARTNRRVRDIVDEALGAWLDAREADEDRISATEALTEYRREGGTPAAAFFATIEPSS